MRISAALPAALSASFLLQACGGSGGGGGTAPVPAMREDDGPSYGTLASRTENEPSILYGTAFKRDAADDIGEVLTSFGLLNHGTGRLYITGGPVTLTDPDGFDDSGGLAGGAFTASTGVGTDTYEYATTYDLSLSSGPTFTYMGVFGIITEAGDIPTTGRATYQGTATGGFGSPALTGVFNEGTSAVEADFAAGTVDVTMTGFRTVTGASGNPTGPAPIDTIKVTGMNIDEGRLSGGTVTTMLDGADNTMDRFGADPRSTTGGAFFGHDGTNPDEVGGAVLLRGGGSRVNGGFIAD